MAHIPRSLHNVAEAVSTCKSTSVSVSLCYDTFGTLNAARTNALLLVAGLSVNKLMWYDELCEQLATPGAFSSTVLGATPDDFALRDAATAAALPPPPAASEGQRNEAVVVKEGAEDPTADGTGAAVGGGGAPLAPADPTSIPTAEQSVGEAASGEEGFFVVRFDNRDSGRSTKFDSCGGPGIFEIAIHGGLGGAVRKVYTLADMADDAASLIAHIGVERAHIIGTSMGGMIAQLVAIEHPHRVFSLTSCMSSTGAHDVKDASLWTKSWFLGVDAATPEELIDYKVKSQHSIGCGEPLDEEGSAFVRAFVRRQVMYSAYCGGRWRQSAAIMSAPSRDDKLSHVTAEALVHHGVMDQVVPVERGYRTAAMLRNATTVVEPHMGHQLMPAFLPRLTAQLGLLARKGVAAVAAAAATTTATDCTA